ncbi:unnamed protein product [Rotaria magnacalcarata]|uniref:Phosphodeoxyriboaldolase n=1 Tax=Rotaria magnacalcarata TaxID=392030 RepID=A0A816P604_9BILA|nr:unnamed protein product [Rotaria magnacalcarata]
MASNTKTMSVTYTQLAKMIDHSLLHPTMTDSEILAGLEIAKKYNVATACVKPYSIPMAKKILAGSDVLICAVIGFPHGNSTTEIKIVEAEAAANAGGQEIDMVINIGKALGGDWDYTSTGYGFVKNANGLYSYKGATIPHLKLMREHCGPSVQIKAAGGVRTLDELLAIRSIGVTRVGATATIAIMEEATARGITDTPTEIILKSTDHLQSGY